MRLHMTDQMLQLTLIEYSLYIDNYLLMIDSFIICTSASVDLFIQIYNNKKTRMLVRIYIKQGLRSWETSSSEQQKFRKHQFALNNPDIFMKTNRFTCLKTKSVRKYFFEENFRFLWVCTSAEIRFFYLHRVKRLLKF